MALYETTSSLITPEAIVLHGANGVTTAPREHFPLGNVSLTVAVVIALSVFSLRRTQALRRKTTWLFGALVVASLPGWVHVLWVRADAPFHRGTMATIIEAQVDDFKTQLPWPTSPVFFVREEDDVLFPLGRYAWPSRPKPQGNPVQEVELGWGPFGQRCRQREGRTFCGAGP